MLDKLSEMKKKKRQANAPPPLNLLCLLARVVSRASYNKRRHHILRRKCDFGVDSTALIKWESKESTHHWEINRL